MANKGSRTWHHMHYNRRSGRIKVKYDSQEEAAADAEALSRSSQEETEYHAYACTWTDVKPARGGHDFGEQHWHVGNVRGGRR